MFVLLPARRHEIDTEIVPHPLKKVKRLFHIFREFSRDLQENVNFLETPAPGP